MRTVHCRGFDSLAKVLAKDNKARRELRKAYETAMRKGAAVVRQNVPVAHGELRDSIWGDLKGIHADAPHAGPVERGSRPHMPPVKAIEEWVKLRGMQALVPKDSRKSLPGSTTMGASRAVGRMLRASRRRGSELHSLTPSGAAARTSYGKAATPVSAPSDIAWAIAKGIAKNGTRPHWFFRKSLPAVRRILEAEIRMALRQT